MYFIKRYIAVKNNGNSKKLTPLSIVEKSNNRSSKTLPEIDKKKFLCPSDITVGQFQFVIRKRLKLEPEQALFLTVKEKFLPPSSALLSAVYQEFKDDDGFLYVSPPCYTHFYYIVEVR